MNKVIINILLALGLTLLVAPEYPLVIFFLASISLNVQDLTVDVRELKEKELSNGND